MDCLRVHKSPYPKQRFGRDNDGGYVVMMGDIDGYDLFLSAGIGDDDSFEVAFLDAHPNLIGVCFDGSTSEMPKGHGNLRFVRKNVGMGTADDCLSMYIMDDFKNVFLKMDIEGGEYDCLRDLMDTSLMRRIRQLVVEFHDPCSERHVRILEALTRTHTLFHLHPNNAGKLVIVGGVPVPMCVECTYVRTEDVSTLPLEWNCVGIPDDTIDMPNIPTQPDLRLSCRPYIRESQVSLNLAMHHEDMGDVMRAMEIYEGLRRTDPSIAVHFNMGLLLHNSLDRKNDAMDCFRTVLKMDPTFKPAQKVMGAIMHERVLDALQSGNLKLARFLAMESHKMCWRCESSWVSLGMAHIGSDGAGTILPSLLVAHGLHPRWKVLTRVLFMVLTNCHRYNEAMDVSREVKEWDHATCNSLAVCLMHLGRASEAQEALLRLEDQDLVGMNLLAGSFIELGETASAMAVYGIARGRGDDNMASALGENYLLSSNYVKSMSRSNVFALHVAWGASAVSKWGPSTPLPRVDVGGHCIRVGYVGSDFREHAVSSFSHHLLTAFDRERFEVYVYDSGDDGTGDPVNESIRRLCTRYENVRGTNARTLCESMVHDGMDLIVDLSGHTSGCNMEVLARKPARVSVSMIGYCNTTGLGNVDYRIVDAITDPVDSDSQSYHTERLHRVDGCFLCYNPFLKYGDRHSLPGCDREHWPQRPGPRLGSFAKLCKVTDEMWVTWSGILATLPDSHLVLKSKIFMHGKSRARFLARVGALGIDASRIVCLCHAPTTAGHMLEYRKVDVMLDTHPYSGTTVTCESLLMGVPVVTLGGETHASNVSRSILVNCGMGDYVCDSESSYVKRVVSLVASLPDRDAIRERFLGSTVCDSTLHSKKIGDAYIDMMIQQSTLRPIEKK